jgi:hypothetical protein
MLHRIFCDFDDMALAIALWMCSLPLMGLFLLPFVGWKISLFAAAALLLGDLIICWGVCSWKIFRS